MKLKFIICLLSLVIISFWVQAQSDTSYVLTIEGDIPDKIIFTKAQLSQMNRIEISAMSMSGESHTYSGIAVADILKAAGVLKPEFHRDNLTKYVVMRSPDNYEVLFSLPELDTAFSKRTIILADLVDGKPLPASKGPYRIVVPGEEKRQARWIWGLNTFIIRFAKD